MKDDENYPVFCNKWKVIWESMRCVARREGSRLSSQSQGVRCVLWERRLMRTGLMCLW